MAILRPFVEVSNLNKGEIVILDVIIKFEVNKRKL